MSDKEQLTITLDGRLLEQLKVLAIYEKRTPNRLLQEAVQDLLKKYEKRWFKPTR
jgi:predicted transcriptional regulator